VALGRICLKREWKKEKVEVFEQTVIDSSDAHVLASAKENKVEFLVTLDKKHLLILKDKIKQFRIVSPGQLIEILGI